MIVRKASYTKTVNRGVDNYLPVVVETRNGKIIRNILFGDPLPSRKLAIKYAEIEIHRLTARDRKQHE